MPKARLNGIDVHYQRFGQGPDVVLLHGLTANLAFWHPTIVTGLAASRTVTLLDFRGHGRSDASPSGYSTRALALDVLALLDHVGVDHARVIGHSWGGAVALHLAVLAPARVVSLVIADARVRSLQPEQGLDTWEHWQEIDAKLRAHGIEVSPEVVTRELGLLGELARLRVAGALEGIDLRPFFVPFTTGHRRTAERWLALTRDTAVLAEIGDVAGLTPEAIARVRQPTLALYGERSHCHPTRVRLEALMPACTGATVPGVGHFHPLLRPEAFLEATGRFFRAAPAVAPLPVGTVR